MTIIDFKSVLNKNKKMSAADLKNNLDKLMLFAEAALKVLSTNDILLLPQNDDGIKKLDELLRVCRLFSEKKK